MHLDDAIVYDELAQWADRPGFRKLWTWNTGTDPYEYDEFLVFTDDTATLWWGPTSGCSCNSPGHEYATISDLHTGTERQLRDDYTKWRTEFDDPAYTIESWDRFLTLTKDTHR